MICRVKIKYVQFFREECDAPDYPSNEKSVILLCIACSGVK